MKTGFVHICFVIDESGSMWGSEGDVCGGFNKVVNEQKAVDKGSCAISLYRFESVVHKVFVGKDVNLIGEMKSISPRWTVLNNLAPADLDTPEIGENDLTYSPGGNTAMNDGIGQAIDEIGEWLAAMPEEERPEKNLIVIITDGCENASTKYSLSKVRDMIKHQEDKYSWEFMYLGTDITDTTQADSYGFVNQGYTSKEDFGKIYDTINCINTNFRTSEADYATKAMYYTNSITSNLDSLTSAYADETGVVIDNHKISK